MSNLPTEYGLPDEDDFEEAMKLMEQEVISNGGTSVTTKTDKYNEIIGEDDFANWYNDEIANIKNTHNNTSVANNSNSNTDSNEIQLKDVRIPVKPDTAENKAAKMLQEIQESEVKKETVNVEAIPENVVSLVFDFIKEQNILNVPEGMEINAENISKIVKYDEAFRNQQALEYIKSKAGDEYVAELFDIVWNGGTINHLNEGKVIIEDVEYFRSMDLKVEENQREILDLFLREGLDEKIPSHKYLLAEVPKRIDNIIGEYKGQEEAEKAVEYYLEVAEKAKQDLEKRMTEEKVLEEKNKAMQVQREVEWRNEFIKDVLNTNWSNEKKNEVLDQFGEVKLNNGVVTKLWDFKLKKIWENPTLTKELFRFLADFDPKELKFKKLSKTPEQEATNMLMNALSKKQVTKTNTKSQYDDVNTNTNYQKQIPEDKFVDFIEKFGRN